MQISVQPKRVLLNLRYDMTAIRQLKHQRRETFSHQLKAWSNLRKHIKTNNTMHVENQIYARTIFLMNNWRPKILTTCTVVGSKGNCSNPRSVELWKYIVCPKLPRG
jgi:hypothetical protein